MDRADDLDIATIVATTRQFFTDIEPAEDLPPLTVENIWIHGSYGADEATQTSDVDLTVEVAVDDTVTDPDRAFTLIDTLADTGGRLTDTLDSLLPGYPDVAVIPAADVLRTANFDAPTAREHVIDKTTTGGYQTVYDALAGDYVPVSAL